MKKCIFFFLVSILLCTNHIFAQNKDYPWLIGFGTHGPQMTINDQSFFKEYFKVKNWNLFPGLGKFWIDKSIGNSFALGTQISLGIADRRPSETNKNTFFLDWDMNLKYKFANGYILHTKCWFDPYVIGSIGLTRFEAQTNASFGLGAGTNIWVTPKFGFNIETSYNKVVGKNRTPSYMHHAIGIVVRLGKGRDQDKDGIADLQDECIDVYGLAQYNGCPDSDGDGIPDKVDACPTIAGIEAFEGCPDTDGDGIVDEADECPRDAGTREMHGCPDRDNDGVVDKEDKCPDVKGTLALNGCIDSDGDGVIDIEDKCPTEMGSRDNLGCPQLNNNDLKQRIEFAAKSIQFETGSDILKPSSYKVLDEVVSLLTTYSFVNIAIEGHTDNIGNPSKNINLSAYRARAVMNYFIGKGISPSRLSSTGYGDTRPIAPNTTAAGRLQNRRVDIRIKE